MCYRFLLHETAIALALMTFTWADGAAAEQDPRPQEPSKTERAAVDDHRQNDPGFVSLFDGKTLTGWQAADMSWWSVEDGAITATITKLKPCAQNQYLFCRLGTMHDFELKLVHRIVSDHKVNGGFQFRSEHYKGDDCKGYQVDNNTKTPWLVRLYDEFGRHTLAWRGERTRFDRDGRKTTEEIAGAKGPPHFDLSQWHKYHLICRGSRLTLRVNDKLVAEVTDDDPKQQDLSGLLALQLHSGPPMKVQFRDIRYRPLAAGSTKLSDTSSGTKSAASELLGSSTAQNAQSDARSARDLPLQSTRRWQKSPSSVALVQGKHVVWQFNYGSTLNAPYFHPLATVDGQVLTWNRPPDHAWHHALWFSWKFINGVNYWEHVGQTGKPDGRTDGSDVRVETRGDHSAVITMELAYHPANDDEVVLRERRCIDISAPDASGAYRMDWRCTFTVGNREVILDRTPPKEQAWGGYAGLSVRFAEGFHKRQLTSSEGPVEFGDGNRYRGHAHAMDYSGLIDGKAVGLALIDHPQNPRHPTPWYAIRDPVMSYINAALLNDEPLTLEAGERMTLRYRLFIHPHRWDAQQLRAKHAQFRQATVSLEAE